MAVARDNLADFKAKVARFANKTVQSIAIDFQAKVGEEVYHQVLMKTPVLTGHARHNWTPTVNTPHTEEVEGVAGVDTTYAPITAAEKVRYTAIRKQLHQMPLGQTIIIRNNAPYIRRLEEGSSAKNPEGMAKVTVFAVQEMIKAKALRSDQP